MHTAFLETLTPNRCLRREVSDRFPPRISGSQTGWGRVYLDSQVTVLAGRGELLDVPVHLGHRQAAAALLPAADDILQPRQHPLQLRVQVAAVIWEWMWTECVKQAAGQSRRFFSLTMKNPFQ